MLTSFLEVVSVSIDANVNTSSINGQVISFLFGCSEKGADVLVLDTSKDLPVTFPWTFSAVLG